MNRLVCPECSGNLKFGVFKRKKPIICISCKIRDEVLKILVCQKRCLRTRSMLPKVAVESVAPLPPRVHLTLHQVVWGAGLQPRCTPREVRHVADQWSQGPEDPAGFFLACAVAVS